MTDIHGAGATPAVPITPELMRAAEAVERDAWLDLFDAAPAAVRAAIADMARAQTFGFTVRRGFGLPPETAAWFAALVGRPGWQCILASVDGEPVAGVALFTDGNAAWSGIAATLPDRRGQGAQAALIAARRDAATDAGASVMTSETGHPATADAAGFSSWRNQRRGGATEVYVRPNYKRPS